METFQKKAKLKVTGKVDDKTWAALVAPMRAALQAPAETGRPTSHSWTGPSVTACPRPWCCRKSEPAV